MQFIRTALWIVVTAILVAFVSMNWDKAPVNLWPLEDNNYIHFQWPVGIIAILFFALGFGPMWFINRTNRWRLTRRITSLENSIRIAASTEAPANVGSDAPAKPVEPNES
ncbi:MAG: LapA family protein [Novosphingobium sp.]|nr:LapA family protein [Novosphingobium sp.]